MSIRNGAFRGSVLGMSLKPGDAFADSYIERPDGASRRIEETGIPAIMGAMICSQGGGEYGG